MLVLYVIVSEDLSSKLDAISPQNIFYCVPLSQSGDRRRSVSTSSDTSEPATSPRATEFEKPAYPAAAPASSHPAAAVKPSAAAVTPQQTGSGGTAAAPSSAAQDIFGDLLGFEPERSHSAPPADQFDPFGPMQSAAPAGAAAPPAAKAPGATASESSPAVSPSTAGAGAVNMGGGGGGLLDDLIGIELHPTAAAPPVVAASTNHQSILALYAQAPPSGAVLSVAVFAKNKVMKNTNNDY